MCCEGDICSVAMVSVHWMLSIVMMCGILHWLLLNATGMTTPQHLHIVSFSEPSPGCILGLFDPIQNPLPSQQQTIANSLLSKASFHTHESDIT